jgi:hypothetical protein
MLSEQEWAWVEDCVTGDFDHLLIATTLPLLLSHGLHHLEAWNEAVCDGAWGRKAARLGEKIRQAIDLEHWSAFQASFVRLTDLRYEVASGGRGPAPASVIVLSGDVHHAEAKISGRSVAKSLQTYRIARSPARSAPWQQGPRQRAIFTLPRVASPP